MSRLVIGLTTGVLLAASTSFAFADGQGAVTGAAGGAVTGAIVGGPVGAAVGAGAGAVVGGAVSGPDKVVVQPEPHVVAPAPVEPCAQTTVRESDGMGNSRTTTTNNCPP